jgi:gluconolactonase
VHTVWDVRSALASEPLLPVSAFTTLADGLDHPEAVACGPHGEIYAGGEAGQLYAVDSDGTVRQMAATGGFLLGLCLDADGNVYACDSGRHEVVRIALDGSVRTWSIGTSDRRMRTPNYPVFAPDGSLYVSDSGSWNADDGCLFRIGRDGAASLVSDTLTAFPNGLAIDPNGRFLYVVLSQLPGVVRLPLGGGEPERVVDLPGNVPDGLAFDDGGNLYIACYTPSVIYRLHGSEPGGQLDVLVADWEATAIATPTNIAFCGANRRQLVVASLSRWHLATTRMDVPGARLFYPSPMS